MNFFWGEQYLLQAFLIGNRHYEVRFSVSYLGKKHPSRLREIFPHYDFGLGGGSFWMERVS